MAKRMLIDATHEEETRVVVVRGNRLEEFDVETSTKKQLKGNIYLAKVTRVEPSLQAAFVDYGGNRHGFLAFSEIHPDYYQIPVADRDQLIRQQAAEEKAAAEEDDASANASAPKKKKGRRKSAKAKAEEEAAESEDEQDAEDSKDVEAIGGDELEDVVRRRTQQQRPYKIQEVIKRRQILLVQVVKEERGNKGAALTTYLSLAGRYCVLMPNTARGGGISRKIVNMSDRKRLRTIVNSFDVPEGMGVIVRTAGAQRSKAEIKRDFEYLLRLWDEIRDLTLSSSAPELVYEEANLIKRSIRDLYTKDIDEILVDGDGGYRTAKDFMRTLMPSHAKFVQPYKEAIPLFFRYQVEQQFDSMYSPDVQLKSGGYIVINPTEALVAIDVNSGKSTKEHNIEETAYKTNLEAAEEVARQLRLRDLAGLIVIDFIDMEDNRNARAVERRLKDCLKADRARIQVGRISAFGLLEMSRQRLRPSLLETSTQACEACGGSGVVRSTESTALHVLRAIEEEGIRGRSEEIIIHIPTTIALYLLNQKRDALAETEHRYDLRVVVAADDSLIPPDFTLERTKEAVGKPVTNTADLVVDEPDEPEASQDGDDEGKSRRRRRRRRKKGAGEAEEMVVEAAETEPETAEKSAEETTTEEAAGSDGGDEPKKRRRRGKRGGRRRGKRKDEADLTTEAEAGTEPQAEPEPEAEAAATPPAEDDEPTPAVADAAADGAAAGAETDAEAETEEAKPRTRRRTRSKTTPAKPRRTRKKAAEPVAEAEEPPQAAADAETPVEESPTTAADEPQPADAGGHIPALVDTYLAPPQPAPESADDAAARQERVSEVLTQMASEIAWSAKDAEPAADADLLPEPPVDVPEFAEISEKANGDADAAPEPDATPDDDSQPKRRGWWRRTV